jgi:pimeloyl-ACP methyl ester carboxylesterase
MTRVTKRIALWAIVLSALAVAGWTTAGTAGAKVIKRPVTFDVRNVNGSRLACPSDGDPYEVNGHLIGPAAKVEGRASGRRPAVTLYLHDFSFGEFFWNFSAVPRYDYAAQLARVGHASVVIDRLGYGSSGQPEGDQICLGAHADVAHQMIGMLRAGDYFVEGGIPVRFDRVALAGHSVGALIANLEAYSFNDIDGLIGIGHTPQVTQQAFRDFYTNRTVCDRGGEPSREGGPGGYAYFGQTDAEFRASVFHRAEPAVMELGTTLRGRDPCGDTASIIDALVQEVKSLPRVKAPVLLVCGREDAITPDFACPYLKRRYTGSRDVSLSFVPRAGHALPLERAAPTFRRRMSAWLKMHGF